MCIELHLEPAARPSARPLTQTNSMSSGRSCYWRTSCNLSLCLPLRGETGVALDDLFAHTSVMPVAAPKKKGTLLPLLTVVFLISYGLMTMLIVEQGEAIQSQQI